MCLWYSVIPFRYPFVSWWWIGGQACCVHSLSCATVAVQWWRNPRSLLYRLWVSHWGASAYLFMRQKHSMWSFFFKGNFQPQSIVKSLVPSLNTLVLFEVSPVSFHQVRGTASSFHRSCTFGCRTLRTCCVCQGLRGFDWGQVSSVAERLVSRPIYRTSSTLHGGLHPKKPTHTKRCKPHHQQQQIQYLSIILRKQLLLLA